MTYPYGVHIAVVEVDPGTGRVQVLRYLVAYEVGRAINPTMVEGQLRGGAAQGIGGALLEELCYDESGQPTATTFMDYRMPTAAEIPRIDLLVSEQAPAPGNPLGVRGAGEGGITAAGATLASAVRDALGRQPGRQRAAADTRTGAGHGGSGAAGSQPEHSRRTWKARHATCFDDPAGHRGSRGCLRQQDRHGGGADPRADHYRRAHHG